MTWREKLRATLAASPQVAATVGSRIFPEYAEASVQTPYVVITEVSREPTPTWDGDSPQFDQLVVQVGVWAPLQVTADAIRDLIRIALSGVAPGGPFDGPFVPGPLRTLRDDNAAMYGASMDFSTFVR